MSLLNGKSKFEIVVGKVKTFVADLEAAAKEETAMAAKKESEARVASKQADIARANAAEASKMKEFFEKSMK